MADCNYEDWIFENIEPDLWIDAIREAQTVKNQGRDVITWLKYWNEQQEPQPVVVYVDPATIDGRYLENVSGQRYNNYQGWRNDDI